MALELKLPMGPPEQPFVATGVAGEVGAVCPNGTCLGVRIEDMDCQEISHEELAEMFDIAMENAGIADAQTFREFAGADGSGTLEIEDHAYLDFSVIDAPTFGGEPVHWGALAISGTGDLASLSDSGDEFADLRTSVENRRGTLSKTLGDGAMGVFAAVADALSCALELQAQATSLQFGIRIGLHTGDAIRADGDYIGITVNKAARITSAAKPGEIMLSSVIAEMATGRGFGLGSDRTVERKGRAGSHRLTQLLGMPGRSVDA